MTGWKDSPLHRISSYDPSYKVESCLHSCLRKNIYSEREVMLEIFSLCCQLELKFKDSFSDLNYPYDSKKLQFINSFDMQAKLMFQMMKAQLSLLKDKSALEIYLKSKGMHKIFPKVWAYLCNPQQMNTKDQKSFVKKYFEQLSSLNQLFVMSQQINQDLYQQNAVSSFGTPLENYKDEIERIFVDVKACLKLQAGQVPHLEEDEKNRLDEMTQVLMELSSEFHPMLSAPLTPIVNFIRK